MLLLVLGLLGCSGPGAPPARQPNVLMVVLDTVRADHLSAYGHPAPTSPYLEALAREGTRYERAWSTSPWTLPAHASLFTGLPAHEHGATQSHLALAGDPPRLASLLSGAGYQTAAFSNNPWVSPKTGLAEGFETFVELWRRRVREDQGAGHPTVAAVERWLAEERDPKRPFFAFVNLMEAHGPYDPEGEAAAAVFPDAAALDAARGAYDAAAGDLGFVRSWYLSGGALEAEGVEAARRLYLGEVREVDRAMGEIVAAVDRVSHPETTTVAVLSDHGEHFGEHGHAGHAFSVHQPLLRIALVVRGPGFAAGRVEGAPVQITDLHATTLAAAGLPPTGGVDLRGPLAPRRDLVASYAWPRQVLDTFPLPHRDAPALAPHLRSLAVATDGRFKLVRASDGTEAVFDLRADPGELSPLSALPEEAAHLPDLLPPVAPEGEVGAPDAETREALRELGYLE